ncbi:MAG: hypothetical protein JWM74_4598 [Myxococcaceae bacterium]|nr:hypothetical protein [Myxococcaceae bacterium]
MTRTRHLFVFGAAILVATTALTPRICRADDTAQAAASLQKFDEGRKAFDAGRFEEALAAFTASNKLQPSPNSLLYIGRSYRGLGKLGSAYVSFKLSARTAQERLTVTLEKRFAATRDVANTEAAELEPRVPRLTLAVPGGTPEDFVLKQNGRDVPAATWGTAIETDPGPIVIEATGKRLKPFKETFDLKEGEQRRLDVKVARLPTAVLALHFTSRPGGMAVTLDGTSIDPTAFDAPREVDTGAHKLVVRAPGYVPMVWDKTLSDGQREEVAVDLKAEEQKVAPSGTPKWMFFAAAGGAVLTLGAGTFVAVHANGRASDENAKLPYARDPEVASSVKSEATIANVLFIAGGVLGAGAAVLAFTTKWKSEPEAAGAKAVQLVPWGGASAGGLTVRGGF